MTSAVTFKEVCYHQKYCTNCPARSNCPIRIKFYSEKEYLTSIAEASLVVTHNAIALGYSICLAEYMANIFSSQMHKKRNRELALYPTYSYN